ncbi:DUF4275 family protein [Roseateles oligotrophus]|uniref:DUF4275 family protein n=1 Tax=Roseateles oligotrophus TaxID=1769250 RepID=A0ABT2YMY1_9BURK|nr:DUF4275 family protein [Roseateles oligotrophus]MCV2371367.1 DUF4275 family protein [Roseateles oligotrophus]
MPRALQPLVEPGVIVRHCTEAEAADLRAAWLAAFGANRHGVNAKDFLWHIFSAGRYPSAERDDALAQYQQQLAAEYMVLSNDGRTAFSTDMLPSKASLFDYYVFPLNFAWTMAFTHEAGWLGPYFARHANFEQLNNANLAQLKKKQEAAAATAKGWN